MGAYKIDAATQQLGIKTAWISDLHLGSMHTHQVWMLNAFYKYMKPETLFHTGDVIDGLELSRRPRWSHGFEEALQRQQHQAHTGTTVINIPGNHDEGLRGWLHQQGIPAHDRDRHVLLTPEGRWQIGGQGVGVRYMQNATYRNHEGLHLLTHGDQGDAHDPARHKLIELYDAFYYRLGRATAIFNQVKGAGPYRNLTRGFQHVVCRAVEDFISPFENRLSLQAQEKGAQGIFCGHIHVPANKQLNGVWYRNPGSMQVDQQALVETYDGAIHLLDWGTIALRLKLAEKNRQPVSWVLNGLSSLIGARRLREADGFSYVNPGVDAKGQVCSTQSRLIALATYGPHYKALPVSACR